MDRHINGDSIEEILNLHIPRYSELPTVSLYKDQVILYIEDVLKVININSKESLLTPTMVNNYVKQKVVSPPKNKRYSEKHLAYLIVVCILKQVCSLTEICELIKIQIETCPIEHAYDYFCEELEKALICVFTKNAIISSLEINDTLERKVARAAVISFVNKLFINKYLEKYESDKSNK